MQRTRAVGVHAIILAPTAVDSIARSSALFSKTSACIAGENNAAKAMLPSRWYAVNGICPANVTARGWLNCNPNKSAVNAS